MIIEKIRLFNFRNYSDIVVFPHARTNILWGKNGQGKTNFIESIYIAAKGDSFRPGSSRHWLGKIGFQYAQIGMKIVNFDQEKENVRFDLKVNIENNKRSFFVDGKKSVQKLIPKQFSVVLFSPESLMAVKNGPEAKRELIDDLLISHHPMAPHIIQNYRQILRSRNKLLIDAKKGLIKKMKEVNALLDSFEPSFIKNATLLTLARIEAIQDLLPMLNSMMKFLFPQLNVDIFVDYVISGNSANNLNVGEIECLIEERLKTLRNAELQSGTTLVGPHKHDIQFLFSGNDARFSCSQGEQRGLILSFKMAQIMYHYKIHGKYPVLLLDDVLSELDEERRIYLIETLKKMKSQVFVTTTDLSFSLEFDEKDLEVYQVAEGGLKEVKVEGNKSVRARTDNK